MLHPPALPNDRRVALGRRREVLVAVVDHPHRLAHALRQQSGVDGDHRRVLLLAAEAAARLGLHDHRLLGRQPQRPPERLVDVVGALQRAVDGDPAVRPWHADHGLVLDVELLLVTDSVLAFDDQVGRREAGVDVAVEQVEMGELLL